MKKKKITWIISIVIIALLVLCVFLWQYNKTANNKQLEDICRSSITSALEHFDEYNAKENESDYIAGVAAFRTYMTAYLCLVDGKSDTNYIGCNILYGDMTLNPEKVKEYIPELVEALEYLSKDYDHPNGFNLINELNNQLGVK